MRYLLSLALAFAVSGIANAQFSVVRPFTGSCPNGVCSTVKDAASSVVQNSPAVFVQALRPMTVAQPLACQPAPMIQSRRVLFPRLRNLIR